MWSVALAVSDIAELHSEFIELLSGAKLADPLPEVKAVEEALRGRDLDPLLHGHGRLLHS